jgi:hypothetical protein
VIDYPSAWHSDIVGEWFPALTGRVSLLTAQGKEWLPGSAQGKTIQALSSVTACRMDGLICLENWAKKSQTSFDYVYFSSNAQLMDKPTQFTSVVEAQMAGDPNYQLLYSNADVRIYQKKKN